MNVSPSIAASEINEFSTLISIFISLSAISISVKIIPSIDIGISSSVYLSVGIVKTGPSFTPLTMILTVPCELPPAPSNNSYTNVSVPK